MGRWTEKINECATNKFGFSSLLPVQQLVIHNVMEAIYPEERDSYQNQLIILPTGTGKSACFQIPVALVEGYVIIIYPLLSLINDQLHRMQEAELTTYKLVGGMSQGEFDILQTSIKKGTCKCVLTNPEALNNAHYIALLKQYPAKFVVIDEAHCISKWGKTFRPSYEKLGQLINLFNIKPVIAFTATASDEVISDIKLHLFLGENAYVLRGYPDRENITYSVLYCVNKNNALVSLLSNKKRLHNLFSQYTQDVGMLPVHTSFTAVQKPAIIFCQSRSSCAQIALMLRDCLESNNIFFYHAGLEKEEKKDIEKWFLHSKDGILVATCAYGMGVDKSNIRTVIHYDEFSDIENFLQETGRAGRDRQASVSIMLSKLTREFLIQDTSLNCRREYFMAALGLECDSCSGCDICVNAQPVLSQEYYDIWNMVQEHMWCFNSSELCQKVKLRYKKTGCDYHYGVQLDLQYAIKQMLEQRILVQGKLLWKGKIGIKKNRDIKNFREFLKASI